MLPHQAESNQQKKIMCLEIGHAEEPDSRGCEATSVLPSLFFPSPLCQRPLPSSWLLQPLPDQLYHKQRFFDQHHDFLPLRHGDDPLHLLRLHVPLHLHAGALSLSCTYPLNEHQMD